MEIILWCLLTAVAATARMISWETRSFYPVRPMQLVGTIHRATEQMLPLKTHLYDTNDVHERYSTLLDEENDVLTTIAEVNWAYERRYTDLTVLEEDRSALESATRQLGQVMRELRQIIAMDGREPRPQELYVLAARLELLSRVAAAMRCVLKVATVSSPVGDGSTSEIRWTGMGSNDYLEPQTTEEEWRELRLGKV